MSNTIQLWAGIGGAIAAAMVSGYFSYRAGRTTTADEHDEEIERRVRELELGMREVQTLVRLNRERRRRHKPELPLFDDGEFD